MWIALRLTPKADMLAVKKIDDNVVCQCRLVCHRLKCLFVVCFNLTSSLFVDGLC